MEEEEYTLSDDAWKDSFDKLLDPRPVLRQQHVLKKCVRISYNMNSSIENCSRDDSSLSIHKAKPLLSLPVSQVMVTNHTKQHASISTPVQCGLAANPFKCSLSPIGVWKFRYFGKDARKDNLDAVAEKFHATPLNPEIIVVDYDAEIKVEPSSSVIKEPSPLLQQKQSQGANRRWRHVCFESVAKDDSVVQSNKLSEPVRKYKDAGIPHQQRATSLALQSGKWRKSLHLWRRTNQPDNCHKRSMSREDSVQLVDVVAFGGCRKSVFAKVEPEGGNGSLQLSHSMCNEDEWASRVLHRCKQREPLPFNQLYPAVAMQSSRKIGEGAYGEVFINEPNDDVATVLKIIPIEGQTEINGETQKTYEQILPEIITTTELWNLRMTNETQTMYATTGFVGIKKVSCVNGRYPAHLLRLWEEYDNDKGSENDHPEMLPDTQLYIVLELCFAGCDLETFIFNNAEQAYYALQQIVLTLAVGEEAYQFEHRDLHWGNILLQHTSEKSLSYVLHAKQLTVPTKGVKITIIDYTLSRMTYNDYCLYNDLSNEEELFEATGDYQFDIYRLMREELKNNWETFKPKTNVFWISYVISKLLDGVSYKNTRTKVHAAYMKKLRQVQKMVLDFESAADCAKYFRKPA